MWTQLRAQYPESKLRLVDVGFPSNGPKFNVDMQEAFYRELVKWQLVNARSSESFWSTFFDRKANDPDPRRHYGVYTAQGTPKSPRYPFRISA